jgi:hypothetical protein
MMKNNIVASLLIVPFQHIKQAEAESWRKVLYLLSDKIVAKLPDKLLTILIMERKFKQ